MSEPVHPSSQVASAASQASFDQLLTRLEQIARRLESNEVPLEEALALFEEGMGLAQRSSEKLDAAERRLEMVLEKGNIGALPSDVVMQPSAAPGRK